MLRCLSYIPCAHARARAHAHIACKTHECVLKQLDERDARVLMGRYLMSVVGANDGRIFVQGGMGNGGYTHKHARTHKRARAHARTRARTRTHPHTHKCTHAHTHTHTCTQARTRTYSQAAAIR